MINDRVGKIEAEYYGTVRHELLDLIPAVPARVLDIGCGNGATLQELKRRGARRSTGFEVNPIVARQARSQPGVDEVWTGDIEEKISTIESESFDLVIASHVLEHLVDPWRACSEIFRILGAGGLFVGAIPNVRHLSVLVNLIMRGRWTYQDSGILDWTHLRFFTRREIGAMLTAARFHPVILRPSILGGKSATLESISLGLLSNFTAYAYNFRAEKPSPAP